MKTRTCAHERLDQQIDKIEGGRTQESQVLLSPSLESQVLLTRSPNHESDVEDVADPDEDVITPCALSYAEAAKSKRKGGNYSDDELFILARSVMHLVACRVGQ